MSYRQNIYHIENNTPSVFNKKGDYGYIDLAFAIVMCAVNDYVKNSDPLKRENIIKFFRSDYCSILLQGVVSQDKLVAEVIKKSIGEDMAELKAEVKK